VVNQASFRRSDLSVEGAVTEVAGRLGMSCEVRWPRPKRIAIFVSKYAHCLWELLLRHDAGERCPAWRSPRSSRTTRTCGTWPSTLAFLIAVFKVTKDTKRSVEDAELATFA